MSHVKSAMFFLGISLFVLGANAKAADYIVPCHIKDSADCYLSSAKKALPYITAKADPMKLKDVNADQGDLLFRLSECVLKGLKNCKILKIEKSRLGELHHPAVLSALRLRAPNDYVGARRRPAMLEVPSCCRRLDQFKAVLEIECPIEVTGKYTLGGNLLGIPVEGNGGVRIRTERLQIKINITLKSYKGKDNEEHYKVAKFDYEYEPLTQVHYDFENLYDGNQEQAKPFLNFVNDVEPSKQVLKTVGKPVVEEGVKGIISDYVNEFFKENPSKDIELP